MTTYSHFSTTLVLLGSVLASALHAATNPIIFADAPDESMIRVGDAYYMSSTTMHMAPGVPIMKSTDLVNWSVIGHAYQTLEDTDELNLENGKNAYGAGSWASCLRFHDGIYYLSTFSGTTNKTYVYTTKDIEHGPWKETSFAPSLHDHSIFFDDDGRVYLITSAGRLRLVELLPDASGIKPGGFDQIVIENASAPAGSDIALYAEGSQLFKVNGKYYLFNITWPKGGMRTVLVHRADKITGPWEGRVALQDRGIAQGGLIDTPQGDWYAYLFRDYGSVGRIPYLVPVKWVDGWPVLGDNGRVPDELPELPANRSLIPGIVASDEFERRQGEAPLPPVWQWNHNPDNAHWSTSERPGFLRLTTGRTDPDFPSARNTITQRTFGPVSSGWTSLDSSGLKDGDFAGFALLQKRYGLIGVKVEQGNRFLVMVSAETDSPVELARIPLEAPVVMLKAECDFRDRTDVARFYYSFDGSKWEPLGGTLHMAYTFPHFMGYRFGLFNYATKDSGGYADFDFFRASDSIGMGLK